MKLRHAMSKEYVHLDMNAIQAINVVYMLNVFWITASKKIAFAYQGLNFGILNVSISMNVLMEHTSVVMLHVSIWKAHTVAQPRLMLFGLLMEQDRIKEMSRLHNGILFSKENIFWHKTLKKQVRF